MPSVALTRASIVPPRSPPRTRAPVHEYVRVPRAEQYHSVRSEIAEDEEVALIDDWMRLPRTMEVRTDPRRPAGAPLTLETRR